MKKDIGVKKKHHVVPVILGILFLLVIIVVIWLFMPINMPAKDASRITAIRVFDGTYGKSITITDPNEIKEIVDTVNSFKLRREMISIGFMGYRFIVEFEPKTGKWDRFIMNSGNTIRQDPFFYHYEGSPHLYNYFDKKFDEMNQ
ncbi:MAG: DUF5301 domain-containing protein [Lachnospiraceae bacterium]|nr:DUF5301 domain-containing protein [Lachnospiraceae bacterium]